MKAETSKYLSLILLAINTLCAHSQTWEESNDPNNLCSGSYSGYKATLDCRGYVYCNEGYLMGGDVIPCWPNQLFDEANAVCTTWQSVTESLGDDISWKCPEYDASLMVPDDKDMNANPQLFFCGTSTFNAKSVCEPCPGGIRTECSDPSHNCYAGITGCPVNPNPPPTPAVTVSEPNPRPTTPVVTVSEPNPPPTTPKPTPNPTQPSVDIELTISPPSDINNDGDRTDSFYLHGKLRTSYYCGFSWDLVIKTCNMAHPCPSGLNSECPMGQTCFPDTPCHELQTPPPTTKPTGKPTSISQATYYCGPDWDWVVNHCSEAMPCPYADAVGVCPDGHKCIADTPCDKFELVGPNSEKPTPLPTKNPTFPPVAGDDPNKRYCGHNWSDVTENCLTAIPCPGGVAFGVCPDGMNCIAETPCKDEAYLDWLRDKQEKVAAEMAEADASGLASATNDEGNEYCMNDEDCDTGLMCNNGYCSSCLNDGTGCSMDQVCKSATCDEAQVPGPKQCYEVNDLDKVCREHFNDARAVCVLDAMACEVPDMEDATVSDSFETKADVYENPAGNSYFCGDDYYSIKSKCLESRPCPGGFASSFCESSQGCFSVLECQAEYENSTTNGNGADSSAAATTGNPTMIPTKSSSPPTSRPSNEATSTPPSLQPISSAPTRGSKNYCGVSWSSHTDDCQNARPCPKGDECESGETCFNNSPCAAINSDTATEESNVKHLCGTDWNTLLNQCKTATPCPKGDECEAGEICYRNFICDPVQINEELSGAFGSSLQNGTTQVILNGQDLMNSNSDASPQSDVTVSSSTTSATSSIGTTEATENEETQSKEPDVAEKAPVEVAPATLEYCNICGSAGEFNYNGVVNYEGFDSVDEMPCGELIWVFARNNVYEGSNECLASRAKYFDECCLEIPKNSCDICPEDHVVYLDRTTEYIGSKTECSRVASLYSTRFDKSSEECRDGQNNHAMDCCFRQCSICENMQPDWEASVFFSGEDLKCNELDIIFREEGVTKESSRCQMTRDLYSDECCLQTLESPCDVCNTQLTGKRLKNSKKVSYEGEMTTCSAVYTHLFSSIERDTETCTRAQRDLVDQCCGLDDTDHFSTSYDRAPEPAENNSPTPIPAPTEDTLSAQWYAGSLDRTSSAASIISAQAYLLLVVLIVGVHSCYF